MGPIGIGPIGLIGPMLTGPISLIGPIDKNLQFN